MKLSSSLIIAYVAANNSQQYEKAKSVKHWEADKNNSCRETNDGYAPQKCGEGNWCCHSDSQKCPKEIIEDLKGDFVFKSAIRQNNEQKWWCMKPRDRRTAGENARIDKCLKNYSGKNYVTSHGKIGFFHRTLSNIAKDWIDAPAYQCHAITIFKQNFLSLLRLRKTCQQKTNAWKKKTGQNYDKWEDWVAEQKQKKADKVAKKKAKKEEKKEAKRTRRDEFEDEGLAFNDDESAELNSLFESLKTIEDGGFTDEDIKAAIEADCTGQEIEDEDYCAALAAALQGERSAEDQQNMEILVKMSKARKGIRIWGHTFIPSNHHAHCNKKRNRLIAKTRFNVRRLMDMRRNHKSSPDKNSSKAKNKRQRLQRKSDREVAKEAVELQRSNNRLKQAERAQAKAEREEQKAAKADDSTAVAEA